MVKNFPNVDGVLAYECPFTGEVCVLFLRNALHIPSMRHNFNPHFIMRSGGVIVNDIPKMDHEDPAVDCHNFSFDHSNLWMHL